MKAKQKKTVKYILWLSLAFLLLYFSFRQVDWKNFWQVLVQSRWAMVFLAMCAGAASYMVRSARWRMLLQPVDRDVDYLNCYDGFTIGKVADMVIPHIGEFVRCAYVRSSSLSFDKALGTVILERSFDILILALLIVTLFFIPDAGYGSFFSDSIFKPIAESFGMDLWEFAILALIFFVALIFALWKLRLRNRLCSKLFSFLKGLVDGVASFTRMEGKWKFLLLTVLLWITFFFTCFFIVEAIPQEFGFSTADILFIMLVGAVAGLVPVPGGFGAFHYIVSIALQTIYGIPFATGIIFATLSHESQAITMIVCGLISYLHQRKRGMGSAYFNVSSTGQ